MDYGILLNCVTVHVLEYITEEIKMEVHLSLKELNVQQCLFMLHSMILYCISLTN